MCDSLPSHGSHHRAFTVAGVPDCPVGEEFRVGLRGLRKRFTCSFPTAPEPPTFLHEPPHQVVIDPLDDQWAYLSSIARLSRNRLPHWPPRCRKPGAGHSMDRRPADSRPRRRRTLRPEWCSDEFQRLRTRAALRRIPVEHLRNTSVSLMLARHSPARRRRLARPRPRSLTVHSSSRRFTRRKDRWANPVQAGCLDRTVQARPFAYVSPAGAAGHLAHSGSRL